MWPSPAPFLMSLPRSFSLRCLPAKADWLLGEAAPQKEVGDVTYSRGLVTTTSMPISEYGQMGELVVVRLGTGLKEKSNGRRPGRSGTMFFGSILISEEDEMMPAETRMRWVALETPSLMR